MRNSPFNRPKAVLIFNGSQILIAIVKSLHSAAELTGGNLQSISFCCTGKYASSGSFYYRHIHPNVEIEISDLGTLQLKEYDTMCGEKRVYYSAKQMARKRVLFEQKMKKQSKNKDHEQKNDF